MTIAVEFFRPIRVPGIVASLGDAYAVLLTSAREDSLPHDRCELPVPATFDRAVPARVRSYVAGRHCATRGLNALLDRLERPRVPMPLEIGALGAPLWPDGVTGSITHSASVAMAVVATRDEVQGIGIDCERIMSAAVAEEVASHVIPEADGSSRFDEAVAHFSRPAFLSIVFSAKESIYKCLSPLTGRFFGFEAVALESVEVGEGLLRFRLVDELGHAAPAGLRLTVRFAIDDEQVVTAVSLPPVPVELAGA